MSSIVLLCSADRSDPRKKKPKVLMLNKSVQVGECVITSKDLISDEPSLDYWKKLAETRGDALNRSLEENEKLKVNVSHLQQENKICKEMLDESRHLVEVLQVNQTVTFKAQMVIINYLNFRRCWKKKRIMNKIRNK